MIKSVLFSIPFLLTSSMSLAVTLVNANEPGDTPDSQQVSQPAAQPSSQRQATVQYTCDTVNGASVQVAYSREVLVLNGEQFRLIQSQTVSPYENGVQYMGLNDPNERISAVTNASNLEWIELGGRRYDCIPLSRRILDKDAK